MNESPAPVDLIHLVDEDANRCVVRVTGRFREGVLTAHDILCADVLVSASFVDARLETLLSPGDLDSWERGLSAMAPGRDAGIGGDRGLRLSLHQHDADHWSVQVHDPDCLTTLFGIRPPEDWIADHHARLDRVRRTWPREVVETSPGAYEWSPDRRRASGRSSYRSS